MESALTILIIDDDEVDRIAVRRNLKSAGIQAEFFEARDCAAAIALLSHQTFDCIFLDYRLPDKDGLALIQELRGNGFQIPMVVLTGQGDEQVAVELMKAGASDYLSKSRLSPEALAHVLRNAIRVHQAELQASLAYQRLQENNDILMRQNQELERQQQLIQWQNLQLMEAARLKSEFLSTVSHELRTPMNAVMGFSQILLRGTKGRLNDPQQDMVNRILSNSRQLVCLIDDILDYASLGLEQMVLHPEMIDLMVVTLVTVERLRPLAEQKQLEVTVAPRLQDPILLNDRKRVQQILTNLVSNAIKFTAVGEVRIEFEETPDRVTIAVHDTGMGIAPEALEHIFEPFRQLDQGIARRHGGTGLGLAITHLLVQMMGGTLRVESRPGQGSSFWVGLPRQLQSTEISAPAPLPQRLSPSPGSSLPMSLYSVPSISSLS